jgi:hypothetical protein
MEDTIFNYIDSILFNKKKLPLLNEGETQFNLYMIDRWCSMTSPEICHIINETSNKYGQHFSSKQEQYDFVYNIFPKLKKKRIEYIKKVKEEKKEENEELSYTAKALELSEREIKEYIDILNSMSN